jgi:hypothetical protein
MWLSIKLNGSSGFNAIPAPIFLLLYEFRDFIEVSVL